VNGYANGWLLDPDVLGPDVRLSLEWTPQRLVWGALAASAIAFLLCLVLAFRRSQDPPADRSKQLTPRWIGLTDGFGQGLRWPSTATVAVGAGLGAWFLVRPWWWAIPVAVLAALAARTRWGWAALRFVAVGLLGLTAA